MAIAPRIEIKQSQSLLMTTELRQAISLLQMSNLELNELINQELIKNPVLEREEEIINNIEINDTTIDTDFENTKTEDFSLDVDYDNEFDDYGSDREGYDNNDNYTFEDYSKLKSATSDSNFDFFEERVKSEKSLYQIIDEQIEIHFKKTKEKIIASILNKDLDDAGYFVGNKKDISKKIGVSIEVINNILGILKTFEPSGVFAESLSDCLKIQLKEEGLLCKKTEILLDNLELLAKGNLEEIKKICDIKTDDEIIQIVKNIRAQNPKPAEEYFNSGTQYIIPDVFVEKNKNNNYIIRLNNNSLPRVLINQEYISILNKSNKTEKKYLNSQISNANFLIKAMNQRATTILEVSKEIVKSQESFFEKGIDYLKPMLLKNIAEAIEMHESTISRVTTNKFMSTPRGLFELKYFFSSAAGSYMGDENTSTITIKHQIKEIIDSEEKNNILSDDKIVEELAKKGIKIARRTIAKYREELNIPSSSLRKKIKNSKI